MYFGLDKGEIIENLKNNKKYDINLKKILPSVKAFIQSNNSTTEEKKQFFLQINTYLKDRLNYLDIQIRILVLDIYDLVLRLKILEIEDTKEIVNIFKYRENNDKYKKVKDYAKQILFCYLENRELLLYLLKEDFLDVNELVNKYSDEKFQKNFIRLVILKIFLNKSLKADDYVPPNSLINAISLSEHGEKISQNLQKSYPDITIEYIKYSLFYQLFHRDLFLDVINTDIDMMFQVFGEEIRKGIIKYPSTVERFIYDRYFEIFNENFENLSREQTIKLLENTPNGIYQLNKIIVGPLGILEADSIRYLPPRLEAPLWSCTDPSCTRIHTVDLISGKQKISKILEFLQIASNLAGKPSEFLNFHTAISTNFSNMINDFYPHDFIQTLLNAFDEMDMREILIRTLDEYSKEIREKIPKDKRLNNIFANNPSQISSKLSKNECLHLILSLSDEKIVRCIEFLIDNQVINIPIYEIRKPWIGYFSEIFNFSIEVSSLGFRVVPLKGRIAPIRLKRLIKFLYENGNKESVKWGLKFYDGDSTQEKIDILVNSDNPKQIIKDFVFSSQTNLMKTFENLRSGNFFEPKNEKDEVLLINKILWKLGFNLRKFPDNMPLFWERLELFYQTVKDLNEEITRHKEKVRSLAVNFFISLEDILTNSLSFCVWFLLSDHYRKTFFKFNFKNAIRFMALKLNEHSLKLKEPIEFDINGKNTLYPLIQGFSILAHICSEIIENEPQYKCSNNELPSYYGKTEIRLCPFVHRIFLLDIKNSQRIELINFLEKITLDLSRVPILKVRNILDHNRPDFPTFEEIESIYQTLERLIFKLEQRGLYPLIYLYKEKTLDQFDRTLISVENYRGDKINFYKPSQYSACGLPSSKEPLIVVPSVNIGKSSEKISFKFEAVSNYSQYWQDFPKRRIQSNTKKNHKNNDYSNNKL